MQEVERSRKPEPRTAVYVGIHEDSSTELTTLSRKKTVFRGALRSLLKDEACIDGFAKQGAFAWLSRRRINV
jgi:hypothetical protein